MPQQPPTPIPHCPGCDNPLFGQAPCSVCVTCDHCTRPAPAAESARTLAGATICPACQDDAYWQCDQCEGWSPDGADCGNGCGRPDDDCDCDTCRRDRDGWLIHDYSYKPRPVFHGTGPLFLGPEIEIATPDDRILDCARVATGHLGALGYLKEDSSIGYGFEIVTHPMSYPWAIHHFPWPMLDRLRDLGATATDRTGLHIHLSRAGFSSPCHTYRWMKFIYRNQPQVIAVARRTADEWAAFTHQDRAAVKHYAKGSRHGTRYKAINTTNRDTFELRIFASSLHPRQIQAAFAFAAGTVEYTRGLTAHHICRDEGWTWPAFQTWLAHQPAYQPLTDQLSEQASCVC